MLFIFESWTLVCLPQTNGKLKQVSCFSLWHLHLCFAPVCAPPSTRSLSPRHVAGLLHPSIQTFSVPCTHIALFLSLPPLVCHVFLSHFITTHTHARTHAYTHACTQAHKYMHAHTHVHTCACTYAYTHAHTHTCVHIYAHTYTCLYTCTRACMHTYT